jgi:hypothetical protein
MKIDCFPCSGPSGLTELESCNSAQAQAPSHPKSRPCFIMANCRRLQPSLESLSFGQVLPVLNRVSCQQNHLRLERKNHLLFQKGKTGRNLAQSKISFAVILLIPSDACLCFSHANLGIEYELSQAPLNISDSRRSIAGWCC